MHFLGIDIGTSAVKAVLVDEDETVVAAASAPLATRRPRPTWAEQDPDDWWRATERVIADLRAQPSGAFAGVRGIGLTGQMHGAVILDEADAVIRPSILWNDGRAVAECESLRAKVPALAETAGIGAMPGFTAPKLMWIKRNEPESFARIRMVLLAKDYVRLRLTGEHATDTSDAAGTLMFDEAARRWSEPIVAATGIRGDALPPVLEGPTWSGMVRAELLAAWGIDHQVVVAGGAGDVAGAAIAVGAINDGDQFVSLGTSAQIFVGRDRYRPQPDTLIHTFAHAVPERWYAMEAVLNGAACLDWLAGVLGESDLDRLLGEAEYGFDGPSPVVFLPYLSGERTPLNDPDARGAFAGLSEATGRAQLVRAVIEGVALSLKEAALAFGDALGGDPIPMIGGGARSPLWMLVLASTLGRPLLKLAGGDHTGPALGAARLARMAATGQSVAEVCAQPALVEIVDPHPGLQEAYAKRLETTRALYAALRRPKPAPPATADLPRRARR